MPSYVLPDLPKPEENVKESYPEDTSPSLGSAPDRWQRTITIPVNDEILEELRVGDKVSIELMGEITGTTSRDTKNEEYSSSDKSIEIIISKVSAYPDSEADDREDEGMEEGYNRG